MTDEKEFDDRPREALKNWLDEDSRHQELVEVICEDKGSTHSVLDAYSVKTGDGEVIVHMVLSDDVNVIHNWLLEEIRDLGYEVFSFGKNRSLYGNTTVSFVEVDSE